MLSFSSFVFSWRMRFLRLKKHKFSVSLSIVLVIALLVWGPPAYQESWLDPFSTMHVPNRELHPRAINMVGMTHPENPFQPFYYTDEGKIQELMRNLQRSTPLSSSEQALLALENQKVKFFTLHRKSSSHHVEEDYALQYYPDKGIVRFGQHFFRINAASILNLTQITNGMTPGWWK